MIRSSRKGSGRTGSQSGKLDQKREREESSPVRAGNEEGIKIKLDKTKGQGEDKRYFGQLVRPIEGIRE
jgi:hypothetical protein